MGMILEMPSLTRETPCLSCFDPVTVARVFFRGRELFGNAKTMCDVCQSAYDLDQAEKRAADKWAGLLKRRMPADYHNATPSGITPIWQPAMDWNSQTHRAGLGLVGPSGTGKSSAIACLVKKLRECFLWWSGTEARDAANDAATADFDRAGARQRWEHGMTVPVLVLDDISQAVFTPAWSQRLFDLLETRHSNHRPTLWTSQAKLSALRVKIARQNGRNERDGNDDQAAAICRRLEQHSLVIA